MKKFFYYAVAVSFFSALFFSFAYAAESCTSSEEQVTEQKVISTDVPKHLKGATIIIRTADGKESSVPAEKFKVVPRKQQFIVTKTEKTNSCRVEGARANRISLLGGHGPKGKLTSTTNGPNAEVESQVGAVGGAQYQHMLNDRWSIGVQGQTNKTGSVLIGIDF